MTGTTGRCVLVVEDEPRMRDMLGRALREMEFEPVLAATAEEGLEALEGGGVDILLSDLRLPGLQGMELCEIVRRRRPGVQILILTGHGDLEAAKRAIRLDAVDFLTKPCSLQELEVALDRALRRRRNHVLVHERDLGPGAEEDGETAPQRLEDVERESILAMLDRNDGNRAATADALGISVRTLYYRLKQYEQQGFLHR